MEKDHGPVERNSRSGRIVNRLMSLKEICLDMIVKNIDRFSADYNTTSDENRKMEYLFLQRCYSDELLWRVTREESLDSRHFQFLINVYLRELDMAVFYVIDTELVLKRLKSVGPALHSVAFRCKPSRMKDSFDWSVFDDYVVSVAHKVLPLLPNVKTLHFESLLGSWNDKTLMIIFESCKELETLIIKDGEFTNLGLKSLCPSNKCGLKLRKLMINKLVDCDEGIGHLLENMRTLQSIGYYKVPNALYKLHKKQLLMTEHLAKAQKYNLTEVGETVYRLDTLRSWIKSFTSMDALAISDFFTIVTELCPLLASIRVRITQESHLEQMYRLSNLISVSIANDTQQPCDFDPFLSTCGKKLKNLFLCDFKLTVSELVENCPNLETLILENICFQQPKRNWRSLPCLHHLKTIDFHLPEDSDFMGCISLRLLLNSAIHLEKLHLNNCAFGTSHDIYDILCDLCKRSETLRTIAFGQCTVPDAVLRDLCQLKKNTVHRNFKFIVSNGWQRTRIF